MRSFSLRFAGLCLCTLLFSFPAAGAGENWVQFKFDGRHSGNAPDRRVQVPLRLMGAAPLSDAVFTAPVVARGRVYVVDGSGAAFCLDGKTLRVEWKVETRGGPANCNNVSSPALAGQYLHFGTMAGVYYVIDTASGKIVKQIPCGEPVFSTPVVGKDRVYFATLGSQVYALTPGGEICWKWDFVRENLGFKGDRWSGADWCRHVKGRVTNAEQFVCSRDIALDGRTLVVPAGGSVVWLDDLGANAKIRRLHVRHTATLGLSIGEDGTVYHQWHWLDNGGQVDILRPAQPGRNDILRASEKFTLDEAIENVVFHGREGVDFVPGTHTHTQGGLLGFSSVSLRGQDVFRCRPEENFGLCRHGVGRQARAYEGCYPAIASPVLAGDKAIYGGLDGGLYVVPIAGGKPWCFRTAFGKAISAPVAVADGRIYFGCEDGYLYALGPAGNAPLPSQDLGLCDIRSPLKTSMADSGHDRFTSFSDWANTNASTQGVAPPFELHWVRRFDGTVKQFSTFGAGRMYTHTGEGQVFAVEQETGRLLWRRYFPGVHISYTTPLYYEGRLLVPQAGLKQCRLRCLDAASGHLLWEAPFAGSPSWNRQQPPVIYKNLAIYAFGTGKYGPEVPEAERMEWLFEHQSIPGFPSSHKPLLRAYDLQTGEEKWTRDFSSLGSGGDDAGTCLLDGRLYYSCFFGHSAKLPGGDPGPKGITAALEPETGKTVWLTTRYSVRGGCTISGKDGRLYLGGYNFMPGTEYCHVWCLSAKDGSLVWRSEPVARAIHVVTIGPRFLFVHSQYKDSYLLDKETGKIRGVMKKSYKCSRMTLCGPCLLGPSMDVYDLSDITEAKLLTSGPRLDPSECIGACGSNGRIFYTGQGGGLQTSMVYGPEAAIARRPWLGR